MLPRLPLHEDRNLTILEGRPRRREADPSLPSTSPPPNFSLLGIKKLLCSLPLDPLLLE